jgi:hypothetical protein
MHFQKEAAAQSKQPTRKKLNGDISLEGLRPRVSPVEEQRVFFFVAVDGRPLHGVKRSAKTRLPGPMQKLITKPARWSFHTKNNWQIVFSWLNELRAQFMQPLCML